MADEKDNNKGSAINLAFVGFVIIGTLSAAYTGSMQEVSAVGFSAAKSAVELAIGLIGVMALWLGLMRVLEAGGCMYAIAGILQPLLSRLFRDVPARHPAMNAIIMNVSANMLGLGNAATPFGIRAMIELNRLNPFPKRATNAMCLFLAINTSSVALLPLGAIGVRAAANCSTPASIWAPSFLSTLASTLVAIFAALSLAKLGERGAEENEEAQQQEAPQSAAQSAVQSGLEQTTSQQQDTQEENYDHLRGTSSALRKACAWISFLSFFLLLGFQLSQAPDPKAYLQSEVLAHWLMPMLMFAIVLYGYGAGVHVYEAVCEGAKQGFEVAVRIIPFLVTILVAIGIFRASGALLQVTQLFTPLTDMLGMPDEVLPMAFIRPLSGSGAFAVMSDLTQQNPDSYEAFLAAVIMGSTETTFYVLAVYFGAAGITKIRHALLAALLADATGVVTACLLSPLFYSPAL